MNIFLIILSIVPVCLLNRYINNKDSEKEPKELLKKLTKGGVYSAILVIIISFFLPLISSIFDVSRLDSMSPLELLLYTFIGVALVEESCKYYYTYKYTYNDREFDYLFDDNLSSKEKLVQYINQQENSTYWTLDNFEKFVSEIKNL